MCFSAGASFAGGIIILSIGIATIKKVHNPKQIVFASIPLFFGLQQFAEGSLWLTIHHPHLHLFQNIGMYIFLTMADVLWPLIIPVSVLLMEENVKRKKIIRVFLILGTILSLYYASCLLFLHVKPEITGYHVYYNSDFPENLSNVAFIIYLFATITPLFLSTIKRTYMLGVLMFFSCLVTVIFFTQFLTSVWCFFAALISAVIYWILSDSKKIFNMNKLNLLKSVKI